MIEGASSLLIVVGQQFQYSVQVNDSNSDTTTTTTNINSVISDDGENVSITATVTNITDFSLTITAKDPSGAATTHTPLAMLCSCANNGTCVELSTAEQEDVETK